MRTLSSVPLQQVPPKFLEYRHFGEEHYLTSLGREVTDFQAISKARRVETLAFLPLYLWKVIAGLALNPKEGSLRTVYRLVMFVFLPGTAPICKEIKEASTPESSCLQSPLHSQSTLHYLTSNDQNDLITDTTFVHGIHSLKFRSTTDHRLGVPRSCRYVCAMLSEVAKQIAFQMIFQIRYHIFMHLNCLSNTMSTAKCDKVLAPLAVSNDLHYSCETRGKILLQQA